MKFYPPICNISIVSIDLLSKNKGGGDKEQDVKLNNLVYL